MTQQEFNTQIDDIRHWADPGDEMTYMLLKAAVAKTMRMCIEHPELSKVYYDNLPKSVME